MSEPQIWTVIGVLASILFGTFTFFTTSFNRVLKAELGKIHTEIGSVRGEIHSLRSEMNTRIDHLDRDVQFLMRREFGENP